MDEAHADLAAAHDHADIDRHVRAALFVFLCLLVLTGFTVTAWTLHLPTRSAIALALLIARREGLARGRVVHAPRLREEAHLLGAGPDRRVLRAPAAHPGAHVLERPPSLNMSLKAFHVVFITASVLLAFFFAAWCLGLGEQDGASWRAAGIASAVTGLGLVAYEAWFLRKTRGLP